jgi:RNA polymerase-binding transcription factor
MTKAEKSSFRRILESRQTELQKRTETREALEVSASPDDLDRIQHATERDYEIGGLERKFSRLREVNGALARLDAGTFGLCDNCEEEISPKRLAAVPWALHCIVCQEAADRDLKLSPLEIDESLPMMAV